MYKYIYRLLKIAVDTYSTDTDKDIKELVNYYQELINKLNDNDILTMEDLNQITALYKNGYKQESFTNSDIENINKELSELKQQISERIN